MLCFYLLKSKTKKFPGKIFRDSYMPFCLPHIQANDITEPKKMTAFIYHLFQGALYRAIQNRPLKNYFKNIKQYEYI
jgi:hypothetical protein